MDPSLSATQSNKTKDLSSYLGAFQDGQERLVLRNADLLVFVLSTKTEKRQYLAEIIGYEALDAFREGIQRAQYQLENNNENVTAKRNLPTHQKAIATIAGTTITEDKQLWEAGEKLAAAAAISTTIQDGNSYSQFLDTLRGRIGSQEAAAQKLRLGQSVESIRALIVTAPKAVSSLSNSSALTTLYSSLKPNFARSSSRAF